MEKQSSKDTRKCESDGASIPRASTSSESDKEVNRLTDEIPDAMSIATRGANGKTGKSSSSSGGGGSSSKEKGHGEGSHYSSDALDLAFPWRNEFRRRCVLALVEPSVNKLDELMAYYIDKFSADLKACYSKPNRAAKLKKTLNDVMLFFYFHYKDLNELSIIEFQPLENSVYLEKMSTLLTFYMDMSIKTSRKKNDDESEIVNSLLVALYLYLDGSPEFILDTILRSKFVSKAHRLFCIPIFIRLADDVLTKTGDKPPPTTTTRPTTTKKEPRNKIVMYVRYILMFKLWKKIVRGAEQRRRVNQLASTQLRAPDDFREALKRGGALADLLPTVPKAKTNITEYYMRAKFNIKEKIKNCSHFSYFWIGFMIHII